MDKFNRLFRCFIFVLFVSLLACNAEDDVADKKIENSRQTQTVSNNASHYIGKPHAPINMRYKASAKHSLNVGQVLHYKIYFSSSIDADDLQVRYKTKADLLIQNPELFMAFGEQRKGKKNLLELDVIPQQEGLFYIYLSATLHVNGQQQSRSFAIPVQVGEQISQKQLKMKSGSQDHIEEEQSEIISMPATETTH